MKRSAVFSSINLLLQVRIQKFLIGGGGGRSKLWFRKDCWTFFYGKLLFSHKHHPSPSRRPRLHVIIPWPLTFYGCTRKGYTLGTSSSVSAGRRSRGKYCFASRGEYLKTITFFNIPGILFSGKMQRAFHWKNQPVKKWYTILSM